MIAFAENLCLVRDAVADGRLTFTREQVNELAAWVGETAGIAEAFAILCLFCILIFVFTGFTIFGIAAVWYGFMIARVVRMREPGADLLKIIQGRAS